MERKEMWKTNWLKDTSEGGRVIDPPASFSFIFVLSNNIYVQFLQQMTFEKMSIQYMNWDSNTWSLEHESPPITTKPGIPAKLYSSACWADLNLPR